MERNIESFLYNFQMSRIHAEGVCSRRRGDGKLTEGKYVDGKEIGEFNKSNSKVPARELQFDLNLIYMTMSFHCV